MHFHNNRFLASFLALTLCAMLISSVTAFAGTANAAPVRDTSNVKKSSEIKKAALGVTANEVATALGIDPSLLVSSSLTIKNSTGASFGESDAVGVDVQVIPSLDFPTSSDGQYVVLSSGTAADILKDNLSGSTSTVLTSKGPHGLDEVQFTMEVKVPPSVADKSGKFAPKSFSFNSRFCSEEFPEYVGSPFNDGAFAELGSTTLSYGSSGVTSTSNILYDKNGDVITINTSGYLGMSASEAAGSESDGCTPLLLTKVDIPGTAKTIKLIFTVFDFGDNIYDSRLYLDDFKFIKDVLAEGTAVTSAEGQLVCQGTELEEDLEKAEGEFDGFVEIGNLLEAQALFKDAASGSGVPGAAITFAVKKLTESGTTNDAGVADAVFDLSTLTPGFYDMVAKFAGGTISLNGTLNAYPPAECHFKFIYGGNSVGIFNANLFFRTHVGLLPVVVTVDHGITEVTYEEFDSDGDDITEPHFNNVLKAGAAFDDGTGNAGTVTVDLNKGTALNIDSLLGRVITTDDQTIVTMAIFLSDPSDDGTIVISKLFDADEDDAVAIMNVDEEGTVFNGHGAFEYGADEDVRFVSTCEEDDPLCPLQSFDGFIGDEEGASMTMEQDDKEDSFIEGGSSPIEARDGEFSFFQSGDTKVFGQPHDYSLTINGTWTQEGEEDPEFEITSGLFTVSSASFSDSCSLDLDDPKFSAKISGKNAKFKGLMECENGKAGKLLNGEWIFNQNIVFAEDGDQAPAKVAKVVAKVGSGSTVSGKKTPTSYYDVTEN